MTRLIWSRGALEDIQRLYRFLLPKNPDAARRAVAAIREGVAVLRTHPEIGHRSGEMPPEFREWLIDFGSSGYLTLYRYDGDEIMILAVRHAREAGY